MSTGEKVNALLVVIAAVVSGSFFGYLQAGKRALRFERSLEKRGILKKSAAQMFDELTYGWAHRHPVHAALLDAWMFAALVGSIYVVVALALVFIGAWPAGGTR